MRKFQIEVWFQGLSGHALLGTIIVPADTEEKAIALAKDHTEYRVSGVDNVEWEVREPIAQYA
jgi:hypothetical protein